MKCSVQFSSVTQSCLTLRLHGLQHASPPCPSPTPGVCSNSCPLSLWRYPFHPLLSPSPPAFNLSQHQGLFQWVSSSHQVSKYWSLSFSISPSNEYLGLLQHHSSKASILQHSSFFIVQLSHPYMTTGKIIALTRWTFVGKVMSLLFIMLSRMVITFLPRSKRLLISWLQSPSAVILEPLQNKVWHCFHCFPIYFPWSDGTGFHDFHFLNVEP